ncbi:MAG: hypothetical protein AAF916_11940, partial [Planctomycetota bacterium]
MTTYEDGQDCRVVATSWGAFALLVAVSWACPASAWTRPGTAPTPGGTEAQNGEVLVTAYDYDDAGRVRSVTDNADMETRTEYDALGRPIRVIENYDNGIAGGGVADSEPDRDRITAYGYNAAGQVIEQTADLPGSTPDQTTLYIYSEEFPTKTGSPVKRGGLLRAVVYPDSSKTRSNVVDDIENDAGFGGFFALDFVETTYLADGSVKSRTDQRGVTLSNEYDDAGRREYQYAQGAAPNSTLTVQYTYTSRGQVQTVKSFAGDPDDSKETSRVAHTYDGFGRLLTQAQSHFQGNGLPNPVTGSGTVTYSYADEAVGGKLVHGGRLETITYPNGREVAYNYGVADGIDDKLSRAIGLDDLTAGSLVALVDHDSDTQTPDRGALVAYAFDGDGRMASKDLPNAGIQLDREATSGAGYDRFGRVTRHYWERYNDLEGSVLTTPEAMFDIEHGYDLVSNRTHAERDVYPGESQAYGYDGLHRLATYDRGRYDDSAEVIDSDWTTQKRYWSLDALGNPLSIDTEVADDMVVQTFNNANELTSRKVHATTANPRPYGESFDQVADEANWEVPAGMNAAFQFNGGDLRFTSLDTQDNVGIALVGEDMGSAAVQMYLR